MLLSKLPDFIEKRLLEEYRELGLCWRHDDEWISKWTAVLLPLSIAALTLPYLKDGAPKLLAVTGGLTLIIYWYVSSLISKRRFEIRFSRIHQIEEILGFDSHSRYRRKSRESLLKHQRLRGVMFFLYLVIAFFVTLETRFQTIEGWTVRSEFTFSTFVYLILIGIVGGIIFGIWIGCRERKCSSD